jgi:DNA-binding winged helix-turn-helix (wHTH) protein/predicted Zn-dependent protease
MSSEMKNLYFADYTLDLPLRQLRQGNDVLPVSGKAFELLAYMAANPGRPLLKTELLSHIWPDSFVEESNLSQNVFLLRKVLGSGPDGPIVTLPGRGYQFAAAVTVVDSPSSSGQLARSGTMTLEATQTRVLLEEETEEHIAPWQSPWVVGVAVAGLVLLVAVGWLGWQRWEDRVGGPPLQVVLADPEGSTGDPVLDRTLISVLRIELAQSPFVTVVPTATVRQTMAQMKQKPDALLTEQLARDLCERTASQAVLRGTVAHAGTRYLLTEEATNCVDGSSLGAAKQDVARVEDLPSAIEKLAASIRHDLGESRRMIARFNQPLAPVDTASIEALKDFSQANYLAQSGKFAEGNALLKQAVSIDPNFAAAYLNLSIYSANSLDPASTREYMRKAYELRAGTTEPTRLFIAAKYDTDIVEDLYQSLRDYQAWIDLYPRSPQPWSGMTEVYKQLGDDAHALKTAQRMRELAPNNIVPYQALADAQMKTGDLAGSRATCQLAISRGFDTESIRYLLLRVGHLMHDDSLIADQELWGKAHPDAGILLANEAVFAQQEGRFADADKLLDLVDATFRRLGSPQTANSLLQGSAAAYFDMEEEQRGRKLLQRTQPDRENYEDLYAIAKAGQAAEAEKLLKEQLAAHPQSTLWNLRYGPLLRGEFALLGGKPQEAISALEPTRQLDIHSNDGFYLRGEAFLAARRLPEAEAEFRALLAHPEREPNSYQVPLAQLELARVLALEGNRQGAIDAYRTFIGLWANGNGKPELLDTARLELAKVQVNP